MFTILPRTENEFIVQTKTNIICLQKILIILFFLPVCLLIGYRRAKALEVQSKSKFFRRIKLSDRNLKAS